MPGLAVVLVGDDPASDVYVRSKGNDARECGFHALEFRLPSTRAKPKCSNACSALNGDPSVHGILVQFPVPPQIRQDGDSRHNRSGEGCRRAHAHIGRTACRAAARHLVSCTPLGVMMLISDTLGDIAGADALVIGRSILVGKPMAQLLLAAMRP